MGSYKSAAMCTVDYRSIRNYVHGDNDNLPMLNKSSLLSTLYVRHSWDELFQALSCFSILQVTES